MVVIVILGIFVLLFFLVRYKGKKNLEANIAAEQQDVFEEMASFQNTIDYHGTTYQYRKDIVNILCIGVDKEEAMWERDDDGGSVGQADAVFLVSLDFEHSNIRILAIPRDTMVSIVACDENGNEMIPIGERGYNPYWNIYENTNSDTRDRVSGSMNLEVKLLPGLKAVGKAGLDAYWWKGMEFFNLGARSDVDGGMKLSLIHI